MWYHGRRNQGARGTAAPLFAGSRGPSPPKNLLLSVSNRRMAQRNIRSFFVPALLQDTATEVGKLKKITLQLTQRIRKCQIASQSSQTQKVMRRECFLSLLLSKHCF